jgi:hypothetical protein
MLYLDIDSIKNLILSNKYSLNICYNNNNSWHEKFYIDNIPLTHTNNTWKDWIIEYEEESYTKNLLLNNTSLSILRFLTNKIYKLILNNNNYNIKSYNNFIILNNKLYNSEQLKIIDLINFSKFIIKS